VRAPQRPRVLGAASMPGFIRSDVVFSTRETFMQVRWDMPIPIRNAARAVGPLRPPLPRLQLGMSRLS
jgi:hypothetical protein